MGILIEKHSAKPYLAFRHPYHFYTKLSSHISNLTSHLLSPLPHHTPTSTLLPPHHLQSTTNTSSLLLSYQLPVTPIPPAPSTTPPTLHYTFSPTTQIAFKGEDGMDAGGVRKEYFMLLMKDLMNPIYGMFTWVGEGRIIIIFIIFLNNFFHRYHEESRLLWFNSDVSPHVSITSPHLSSYFLLPLFHEYLSLYLLSSLITTFFASHIFYTLYFLYTTTLPNTPPFSHHHPSKYSTLPKHHPSQTLHSPHTTIPLNSPLHSVPRK